MLIAELERGVLRLAQPWCVGKAIRPARLPAIDRIGDAAFLGGDHLLAATPSSSAAALPTLRLVRRNTRMTTPSESQPLSGKSLNGGNGIGQESVY
jgi:hypothetical protein